MQDLKVKVYPRLTEFRGINTALSPLAVSDSEAVELINTSSDIYPAISQRREPTEVMQGSFYKIKYLGKLFDKTLFCIASENENGAFGFYVYKSNAWSKVTAGNTITAAFKNAEVISSTLFNENITVLGTGGKMITVKADGTSYKLEMLSPKNVPVVLPDGTNYTEEPMPTNVNFVVTKGYRLYTGSLSGIDLCCSQYQQINWINADDIQIFHAATDAVSNTSAICEYSDMIMMFKENSIHLLYGKNPDSYSFDLMSKSIGCTSFKSIAETNKGLMWLAKDGIYMYSATTLPYKVSEPVKKYISEIANHSECAAASDGVKYYLSAALYDGKKILLVYDTGKGVWHVEDNIGFNSFLYDGENIIGVTDKKFYTLGTGAAAAKWRYITKPFDMGGASKTVNLFRIYLSLRAKSGARLDVGISNSVEGGFTTVKTETFSRDEDKLLEIPLLPTNDTRSLSFFRVKLSGSGECEIYGLEVFARIKDTTY